METNVLKAYLTLENHKAENGLILESCLTAALREARYMTGRNHKTGLPDSENRCGYLGHWIGAMAYITILDQIGKTLRPKSSPHPIDEKRAIIKALHYFTNLPEDEILAIYALRNAFFHDFSLYNKDNTKNFHRFQVDNHPTNKVVILPKEKWDGKLDNNKEENKTYINLKTLGDLVEGIYSKLLALEEQNELLIDLPEGEKELKMRYTIWHY